MKSIFKTFSLLLPLALGWGCGTPNQGPNAGSASRANLPIDQVPMYGGFDRQTVPDLKKGDEAFIASTAAAFGGREKASMIWVDQGFNFYRGNDNQKAMKRFNQAWLLDPKNPEVYWGFGSILHDRGQASASYDMLKRAHDLGFRDSTFLADLGKIAVLRTVEGNDLSDQQKEAFKQESEGYFQEAAKSKDRLAYIYDTWASAKYWQADYAGAWEKISLTRKHGGNPSSSFLKRLSAKMPEPK